MAGRRRADARAVLLGTAFTVKAALLFVHGLASPGVLVGMNGVVALTGAATLPVGGAILVLAAFPGVASVRRIDRLLWLQAVLMAGVVSLGVIALALPGLVPPVPDPKSAPAMLLLAAGLAFYALVGWRAVRTVMLARRRSDVLVIVGIVWLAAALVPALTMDYTAIGWWFGHGVELVGILLVGAPVAIDLFRAHPSRPLAGDLCGAELVSEEEAYRRHPSRGDELLGTLGFGSRVRRLVLDHHERLDGSGYPRGLTAAALDLDTSILAVCDVYDALVSTRVYREAWTHDHAVALLRDEAGEKLDIRCVAALERVLERGAAVRAAA